MKGVVISKGKIVCVDDDDFEWVSKFKWFYRNGYAMRDIDITRRPSRKRRCIRMHREINGTPEGFDTDHINGDTLDNRKENLRTCTKSQNGMNRDTTSNSSIGLKGVTRNGKGFLAQIQANKSRFYLGTYKTPEEAHLAYRMAASKLHGDFAKFKQ